MRRPETSGSYELLIKFDHYFTNLLIGLQIVMRCYYLFKFKASINDRLECSLG